MNRVEEEKSLEINIGINGYVKTNQASIDCQERNRCMNVIGRTKSVHNQVHTSVQERNK